MIAYKLFRIDKEGRLHPMFVLANQTIPLGRWLDAKAGPKDKNGYVRSKIGPLIYRPGWHLSEMPYAPHLGVGWHDKVKPLKPDMVWTKCLIDDRKDFTKDVEKNGWINGKFYRDKACMYRVPRGGFYWFNTRKDVYGHWMITGRIKVLEILPDEEVERICWEEFGVHAQPRKGKRIDL